MLKLELIVNVLDLVYWVSTFLLFLGWGWGGEKMKNTCGYDKDISLKQSKQRVRYVFIFCTIKGRGVVRFCLPIFPKILITFTWRVNL